MGSAGWTKRGSRLSLQASPYALSRSDLVCMVHGRNPCQRGSMVTARTSGPDSGRGRFQSRYASYLHIQEVLRARKKGKYPFPDSYPLPQANRMAAKSRMSGSYRDQILGTKMFSIPGYTILPNGQKKTITTEHPYIPLIPESFGKNIR